MRASRQADLVDASRLVDDLRMRKSAWEIAQIEHAGVQARQAQDLAAQLVRDGASDLETQLAVEYWLRREGHPGIGHGAMDNGASVVVLAGPDAAVPGYTNSAIGGPGRSPAAPTGPRGYVPKVDDSVVVDLLGHHNGYFADQTCTISTGELAADLARAQTVCEGALDHMVAGLRVGITAGELYRRSVEVVAEAGMLDFWMGAGASAVRFVGHGIGSAVSEEPFIAPGRESVLPEGTVIALEPKLVFPGRGAVGVEHTYALGVSGPRRLTSA
jgi:Xaa-Pro aminopeptidase